MCPCVFNKLYICVLLRLFGLNKTTLTFIGSHITEDARFLSFHIGHKFYDLHIVLVTFENAATAPPIPFEALLSIKQHHRLVVYGCSMKETTLTPPVHKFVLHSPLPPQSY